MARIGPWMTRLEVEVRLGMGREKVRRLVETGELQAYGSQVRPKYSRAEVEAYAERRTAEVEAAPVAPEVVAM